LSQSVNKHGHPRQFFFLIGQFLKIFFSDTAWPNRPKLGRRAIFIRGLSIDASYQVSDHLAMRFQRRRFLEIDQSETRIACGGHVIPIPLTNMATTGNSYF
jgi:hypothetical protein